MARAVYKDTVGVVERVFQKPANMLPDSSKSRDVKRTYEENKELKAKLDNYAVIRDVKQLEDDKRNYKS